MTLFHPEKRTQSARHARLWARFEIAFTAVDFAAAFLFVIGSVMFLYENLQTPGTWCFIVGSVCFALKPTIRLVREMALLRLGDIEDVAERADV